MADVQPAAGVRFDAGTEVAIIGGGACGLVAAPPAVAPGRILRAISPATAF